MIILSTHTSLNLDKKENFGPFHNLENFLKENKTKYICQKEVLSTNPFKIFLKILKNLLLIYQNKNFNVYVGFDPVNALSGIIGRSLINKNLKVIFYSIDYSKKRTGFFITDKLYIYLDKYAALNSNETWNCSYKVFKLREKYLKNNFFVPNIPVINKESNNKFSNFTVVFTGYFNHIYRIDLLKELINNVKELDINLFIIGDGKEKANLKNLINNLKLEQRVFLKGYLEHKEVMKILSQSNAGLALYSGSESYDEYRDSMKIREFTFLELPTICTDKIPNSEEIIKYNLGKVIKNKQELFKAINFLKNKDNLEKIQKNCKEYNKKIDIKKLYKNRIFGI